MARFHPLCQPSRSRALLYECPKRRPSARGSPPFKTASAPPLKNARFDTPVQRMKNPQGKRARTKNGVSCRHCATRKGHQPAHRTAMLLRLPDRHAGIRNTATPTQPTQPTQGISPHKTIWGDALMMPKSSQTPNEPALHTPPPPRRAKGNLYRSHPRLQNEPKQKVHGQHTHSVA